MKKILSTFILLISLFVFNFVFAEDIIVPIEESPEVPTGDVIATDSPTSTPEVIIPTESTPKENFIIRNGDSLIWSGEVNLPESSLIQIDGHDVDTRSVLGLLYSIDQTNDNFSLSDLSYSEMFGTFYLRCITPKDGEPLCDNWQYAVDLATPLSGMAGTTLLGGETVGLYFGSSHNLILSSNSVYAGDNITINALKYNYENNSWIPLTSVNIGLTLPNKDDPWNPIIVATYAVDNNGVVTTSINEANTYGVGIAEDYYFPSYSLNVSVKEDSSTSFGGAGQTTEEKTFSVEKAISFLASLQESDGSFGEDLYTDWVAVALGTSGNNPIKSSLIKYLKSNEINSSVVTDYERRAMALMSLDINPYSGTNVNYIEKIVDSFDGEQIGEKGLINDDIFGLIVLGKVGYSLDDEIINKTIKFILSKQLPNGSFGSVDLTSAGIQALNNFSSVEGVSRAISLATNYIEGSKQENGSFGNIYSTSWAIQALSCDDCVKDSLAYLTGMQQEDGGVSENSKENRIWSTSYVIPAALQMSWGDILSSFSKKVSTTNAIKETSKVKDEIVEEDKVEDTKNVELPEVNKVNNSEVNKVISKKINETKKQEVLNNNNNPKLDNVSENNTKNVNIKDTIYGVFFGLVSKISTFFNFLWTKWSFWYN